MQKDMLKTNIFLAAVSLRLGKAYGKNDVLLYVNLISGNWRGSRTPI